MEKRDTKKYNCCVVWLPTATVCSSFPAYRLRYPIVRRLPSRFVVALASSALCPSRRVEHDSSNFASPRPDHPHVCASISGVSRDTDQEAETRVQVSRESHPSGTDGKWRRAVVRL